MSGRGEEKPPPWSEEEIAILRSEARDGGPWEEIAARYRVRLRDAGYRRVFTPEALRVKAFKLGIAKGYRSGRLSDGEVERQVRAAGGHLAKKSPEDEAADFRIAALEEIRVLKKENQRLSRDTERLRIVREEFLDAVKATVIALPPPDMERLPNPSKTADEETALLHVSDAQIGAFVDPSLVGNLSEYSYPIFVRRLRHMVERTVAILRHQRTPRRKIDDLVVLLGGDMVEGEAIFPGQAFQIDTPLFTQALSGGRYVAQAIRDLAAQVKRVKVVCVRGNHGRSGKKGDHHVVSNWDDVMYHFIAEWLRDCKNVEVWVSLSPFCLLNIYEWNFLASHGDEFKGWSSIPAYGMRRAFLGYVSMTRMRIDAWFTAHHHQPTSLTVGWGRAYMNGSFPGGSELSITRMQDSGPPTQKLYFIHRRRKVTSEWPIELDDLPMLRADGEGFFTPVTRPRSGKAVWDDEAAQLVAPA